jgi:esterase/lipase
MVHFTGHSMKHGPLDIISDIHVPLLMLHSREDLYSTPEFAQKLYDASGAENKTLVWFEHGRHSMLRVTDTELYDSSIDEFLSKLRAAESKKTAEVI